MGLVDLLAHLSLVIGLECLNGTSQLLRQLFNLLIDLIERNRPVLGRVPLPEHVMIDPMQKQNLFHIILP